VTLLARLGLVALLAAITPAVASPAPSEIIAAPIDLRPPVALRKKVVRIAVPLPRLRPDRLPVAEVEVLPAGVSSEIVGATRPAAAGDAPVTPDTPRLAARTDPPQAATAAPGAGPQLVRIVGDPPPPAAAPAAVKTPLPTPVEVAEGDDLPGDPAEAFADHAPKAVKAVPPKPKAPPRPKLPAEPIVVGEPFELVRTLQTLQDQIAQGSTKALLEQRNLRARIDQQFAAAKPQVWQDKRNAAAAVVYVLSGGTPNILRQFATLDPKPAIDARLAAGVLAYVEGKEVEANDLLGKIDVFDLPASMSGAVALAQSALAVRADPAKAVKLLDVARLLAPGTLVEEAALRREIFVADQMKDTDRVETLGRQYLERFRHSVYAGNFRNRFAAAVSHMDLEKNPDRARRLDDMLAAVEPAARGQLYLTFALAAVVKGNALAAVTAAERAVGLSAPGSLEEARARLYRAAARVADPKALDGSVADLATVKRDLLTPSDQALYDDVAITIKGITSGTEPGAPGAAGPFAPPDQSDKALMPIVTRASDAIHAVDKLLAAAK
jgi:chemotaxis protein MotC